MPAPLSRTGTAGSGSFDAGPWPAGSFPALPRSDSAPLPGVSRFMSPDPLQRRDPLARDGLKLGAELGRVVGDELGAVARPADLDVERLLRGEVRMPRLHRRDHVVDGAALERVHGRRPGVVEMAHLRIAEAELGDLFLPDASQLVVVDDGQENPGPGSTWPGAPRRRSASGARS